MCIERESDSKIRLVVRIDAPQNSLSVGSEVLLFSRTPGAEQQPGQTSKPRGRFCMCKMCDTWSLTPQAQRRRGGRP